MRKVYGIRLYAFIIIGLFFIFVSHTKKEKMPISLLVIIITVYVLLVLASMAAVMLDNRQPVKTIAWLMVIFMIPVVGLLLYYFFGQNIRREHILSLKSRELLSHSEMSYYVRHASYDVPPAYVPVMQMMKKISSSVPFPGNQLRFYSEGADFFIDLLKDIASAKHHIHLDFFIFNDDSIGRLVRDALIDAVKRGVMVRLIYDSVGCWTVSKRFFREMDENGIMVKSFQPVHFRRLSHRVNYRNHRKIVVVDGLTGYVGGMNVAERYVRGKDGKGWRDGHCRVQGAVVYGLQKLFLEDWYYAYGELINGGRYYPEPLYFSSGVLAQIVQAEPYTRWPNVQMACCLLIQKAQRHIQIQTPYFMPTEPLLEALQSAAISGVKVQIMVPLKPGGFWVTWGNESYFGDVLSAGAEIYAYQPGMLHSKVFLIDDDLCYIGSANLDFRSLMDTFESGIYVYDTAIAQKIKQQFDEDKKHCMRIDMSMWKTRNRRRRIIESFVRLFSPLF